MQARHVVREYPITYRQLDLWTKAGYLGEGSKETGSGKAREYSRSEITLLERIILFVAAGVRPQIAAAIARGDVDATRKLVKAMKEIGI